MCRTQLFLVPFTVKVVPNFFAARPKHTLLRALPAPMLSGLDLRLGSGSRPEASKGRQNGQKRSDDSSSRSPSPFRSPQLRGAAERWLAAQSRAAMAVATSVRVCTRAVSAV